MDNLYILKFGGAAVATPEAFARVAEIVQARTEEGHSVVVVVSAMGNMTDQLIRLATRVNPDPPKREMDMLVSVGERVSVSLLAMALQVRGQEAVSFTGSQSGILTTDNHSEARIVGVRPGRLLPHLEAGRVVIVAGFQGVSADSKEITTLGRGGSDTTAVALGVALEAARVEFYKDVAGIHEMDPGQFPESKVLDRLTYGEALAVVGRSEHAVLHPRAIELAERNGLQLLVRSFQGIEGGTLIGEAEAPAAPIYEFS